MQTCKQTLLHIYLFNLTVPRRLNGFRDFTKSVDTVSQLIFIYICLETCYK